MRRERDEPFKQFKKRNRNGSSPEAKIHQVIEEDPAIQLYFANLKARPRNNGLLSKGSKGKTLASSRSFLQYLQRDITNHAISDLINETRQQHKTDNFSLDDKLLVFSNLNPLRQSRLHATFIKGIFKANRCPLQGRVDNHFTVRTAKISDGILSEIYLAQSTEKRTIMDWQAYAGERIGCLSRAITLDQIELYNDKYAIIHVKSHQTKARIDHPCIVPRTVAEKVLEIAKATNRTKPFPNWESLWREITAYARDKYGVRLTSHYLRKRFHSIAQKTAMPVNDWDFLMGDKLTSGHEANVYTLEDWSELVTEYDTFLAPRLNLAMPYTTPEPIKADLTNQINQLLKENADLKQQILKLTKLLTDTLSPKTT